MILCDNSGIVYQTFVFQKRGPQRSVDIIVSAAFIMAVFLVSVMCFEVNIEIIAINNIQA